MTFTEFFQQNIIFFVAGVGIFAFLITLEIKGLKTKGATLTPTLLTQQVNQGATLIDLRSDEDFKAGHITGATHIPMETLKQQPDSVGDKNQKIVLYCARGNFSASAVTILKKAGFTDVMHLGGGMNAWRQDNLPVVTA